VRLVRRFRDEVRLRSAEASASSQSLRSLRANGNCKSGRTAQHP
jgi:hypothetical protein